MTHYCSPPAQSRLRRRSPELDLPGVRAFRDMADAEAMLAAARSDRRAVVIGGGLLGLEAAWGLKRRGMSVALVHLMPTLMERQLDIAARANCCTAISMPAASPFSPTSQTEEIAGRERVEAVVLADGRQLPPILSCWRSVSGRMSIWRRAGLDVNRGILVGDDMR